MSTYDAIADWYDAWIGDGPLSDDPFWPATEALLSDVRGQRICDLACGQGRIARHLAQLGAHVVGVDISHKLLAIARHHEMQMPLGIEYVQADVRDLRDVPAERFDGVVCSMALMDIEDLSPTLHTVARIVRPGGWFVFSILHPCFNSPPAGELPSADGWLRTVRAYWAEGYWVNPARTGPPGRVGAYHRTLATYVNALTAAGLVLEQLSEPRASGARAESRPVWTEVPAVLIARATKGLHVRPRLG